MPPAAASLLVDADTGRILYAANADTPLPPASLTKVITGLIAAHWLPPAASVPVDTVAFNAFPDKVGMKPGQKWPLPIVKYALITDSANDAAYALAEDIGGSLPGFDRLMSLAAGQLGMTDHPVLRDPAGLDGTEGFEGGNLISARDLAVAARAFMADPGLAAIAGAHTYDFEGPDGIAYHLRSHNIYFLLTYPGAIGVKTGFTDRAGYCEIEEAVRDGRHMLAVVMHSTNPNQLAADLLDAGFAIPASSETGRPSLPPVVQPEPPSKFHPATTSTTAAPAKALRPEPLAVAAPAGHRSGGLPYWVDGAAGATVVAGLVVFWRGGRRRGFSPRTRPAGGHSRRR